MNYFYLNKNRQSLNPFANSNKQKNDNIIFNVNLFLINYDFDADKNGNEF